jgi:ubiquinone/menaquinone biosynthesis C-methylase UbiE
LASLTSSKHPAWDCATGNGLSALALANYFDQVIATDGSAAQIEAAPGRGDIDCWAALAEDFIFEPTSADLLCVSQACIGLI